MARVVLLPSATPIFRDAGGAEPMGIGYGVIDKPERRGGMQGNHLRRTRVNEHVIHHQPFPALALIISHM
jgi:hypothetical protein